MFLDAFDDHCFIWDHKSFVNMSPHIYNHGVMLWMEFRNICDCCENCDVCCVACVCPCLIFGDNYQLLKDSSDSRINTCVDHVPCPNPCCKAVSLYLCPMIVGGLSSAYLSDMGFVSLFSSILQCYMRGKVREFAGYNQNKCEDCCVSFLCYSCALAQEQEVICKNQSSLENINPVNSMRP